MRLSPQPHFRLYGSSRDRLVLAPSALIGGGRSANRHVIDVEQRVAKWTGAPYAAALPQARVGLYLALLNLVRPGQKVILSPYTLYDVINMVICAGGKPVFADIAPETCNLDAEQVESLIDGNTAAVIATHLHGLTCDIKRIAELCRLRKVALIEDAAQCFGGRVDGQHVGTFGDIGVFSFSSNKNVNALYGGIAVTRDKALRDQIADVVATFPPEDSVRLLKRAAKCLLGDLATAPLVFQLLTFWVLRYDCLTEGRMVSTLLQREDHAILRRELPAHYRRQMTSLQARLIARQLPDVDRHMEIRLNHARAYHRGLAGLPQVGLPPLREDGSHIYLTFPIQVSEPQQFVQHMMRHRRDIRAQYFANAADLPCFSAYARDCPHARATAARVVLLPTYPSYGEVEVANNIAETVSYFRRRANSAEPFASPSA